MSRPPLAEAAGRSSGREEDPVNVRPTRLVLAVLAGVLIGVLLDALVKRAVPAQPWQALGYIALTAAVFVLVIRTSARGRE